MVDGRWGGKAKLKRGENEPGMANVMELLLR